MIRTYGKKEKKKRKKEGKREYRYSFSRSSVVLSSDKVSTEVWLRLDLSPETFH